MLAQGQVAELAAAATEHRRRRCPACRCRLRAQAPKSAEVPVAANGKTVPVRACAAVLDMCFGVY